MPFALTCLGKFPGKPRHVRTVVTLRLLITFMFVFVKVAGLTSGFIGNIPGSVGNNVLVTTPVAMLRKRLSSKDRLVATPVTALSNALLLTFLDFSPFYRGGERGCGVLSVVTGCKGLFPCLVTVLTKMLLKRLSGPILRLKALVQVPSFDGVFRAIDVFTIKFPPVSGFVDTVPLTLVYCMLTFKSFIASRALMRRTRSDEDSRCVSFGSDESGLVDNLEGLVLTVFTPFPPLTNPL